jgi:hypothetical protein
MIITPPRAFSRVWRGDVDIAEHLNSWAWRHVGSSIVDRAARNVAGIVDEDVGVISFFHQPRDVLGLAQIDDMGRGIDLVSRSQALGNGLELIAAAGRKAQVAAFFGKGFGGRSPNALRGAGDQDAFVAQMKIHGTPRLMGNAGGEKSEFQLLGRGQPGGQHCSAALQRRHCAWSLAIRS